jgi:signal peptidase
MTNFKKILNGVSTGLVVIMVLLALLLMGARLLGYRCFTVISGSMEPKYKVGDLIYVKSVNPNSIKAGDDITFILNEDLVVATHQVVRVDAENQHFYTKGLANELEDKEPVHLKNVIGVPHFSVPKLGYVSNFVQNPPGMYITIGVGIILILIVFVPDLFGKKKKEELPEVATVHAEAAAVAEENEKLKEELERLKEENAPHLSSGESIQLGTQKEDKQSK